MAERKKPTAKKKPARTIGQPKKIKSAEELFSLWEEFCLHVVDSEYKIAPTYTMFKCYIESKYKSIDRKTIYTSINRYFPNIKDDIERMRADIVAQGTMLGAYQPSMSIFALKNWCGWTDKTENTNINTDNITINFEEFADDN